MTTRGVVVAFDDHVGLGTIQANGESFAFHCAEIRDGTRTIQVGTEVEFEPRLKFGRPEAFAVTAIRR